MVSSPHDVMLLTLVDVRLLDTLSNNDEILDSLEMVCYPTPT